MTAYFLARIREAECVGCMKCIKACPVDAILGAMNQLHTVIIDECIGCQKCVPPCPVDCIDLIEIPEPLHNIPQAKMRVEARKKRLAKTHQPLVAPHPAQLQKILAQAKLDRHKSR